jgi:hypothetical protein
LPGTDGALPVTESEYGQERAAQRRINLATTPPITFDESAGVFEGTDQGGRQWRIWLVRTGWHLEFRDASDMSATFAGTHPTLANAMTEADR